MRWAPQDWLSSSLRGELALAKDHLSRAVYRDLLDVLHNRGGYIERSRVAGACLVTPAEAEHAIGVLIEAGAIHEDEGGRLYNERVLQGLAKEAEFRDDQRTQGAQGGKRRAESMTAEERSEAARKAANARHRGDCEADAEGMRSDPTHMRSPPSAFRLPPAPSASATEESDPPKRAARAAPDRPKRRMLTEAPDDLDLEQKAALKSWCEKEHPDRAPHLRALVTACLDFHRAKGNRHADWTATCRTWVRNEAEGRFGRARAPNGTARKPLSEMTEAERAEWNAGVEREMRRMRGEAIQ